MLGIEFAPDALRAVSLPRFRRGAAPDAWAQVPLPEGLGTSADGLARAIGEAMVRLGHPGGAVALVLPSPWVSFRQIYLPHRSMNRALASLAYSIENRLPGDISDFVAEALCFPRPAGERGSRLLAAACQNDRLRSVLAAMAQAGLDPCVAQPAASGLARFAHALAPAGRKWAKRVLVVRLAGAVCDVALAERGEPVAAASAPTAGLDPGRGGDAEAVARHVALMAKAMAICDAPEPPERALLLAPESACPAMAQRLEQALGLPTDSVEEPGAAQWAAAWGTACDAAERGRAAPTLRQGGLAYPRYARRPAKRVAAAAILMAAALAYSSAQTWRAASHWNRRASGFDEQAAEVFAEATGMSRTHASLPALQAAVANARNEAARAGRAAGVSCLRRWAEFMDLVPPQSGIEFQRISIDQRGISLTMRATDAQAVWDLQERARASEAFSPDAPVRVRDPGSGEANFTMELRYRH